MGVTNEGGGEMAVLRIKDKLLYKFYTITNNFWKWKMVSFVLNQFDPIAFSMFFSDSNTFHHKEKSLTVVVLNEMLLLNYAILKH